MAEQSQAGEVFNTKFYIKEPSFMIGRLNGEYISFDTQIVNSDEDYASDGLKDTRISLSIHLEDRETARGLGLVNRSTYGTTYCILKLHDIEHIALLKKYDSDNPIKLNVLVKDFEEHSGGGAYGTVSEYSFHFDAPPKPKEIEPEPYVPKSRMGTYIQI